jgi:fibronectin type 3 domain-containing protein
MDDKNMLGVGYMLSSFGQLLCRFGLAIGFAMAISTAAIAAPPPEDLTPPTVPKNLWASSTSPTEISLSWSPSTGGVAGYMVYRCLGAGCSYFAYINNPTSTTVIDSGLSPSTSYSYRVLAYDLADNASGYSNIASATTLTPPDTQAPSAPGGLTAAAASSTQINLSWNPSSDNVGVSSYVVEQCNGSGCSSFSYLGTTSSASYSSTGLTNATSYSYRVSASDAAGNVSSYSGTASAVTPDSQAPAAPPGLAAAVISSTQINLSWTAPSDNVGVTGYIVESCAGASCSNFTQISTPTATSYSNTGLTDSTTYRYQVRARDAAGNVSSASNIVSATTLDGTPPLAPTGLTPSVISSTQINLSWTAPTDNVGVTGYIVESCAGASCTNFAQVGTPTATSYSNTGLTGSTTYRYQVRAKDAAGNVGSVSNLVSVATLDGTAPTPPTSLASSVISSTQINLTWTAATDAVGVTGYIVESCAGASCTNFTLAGTPTATSFSNTGLTGSTTYRYQVRARDAAGNVSSASNIASATTQAANTPPTVPTNLQATVASSTQINLSWGPSTDNVAVTGYQVQWCSGAGCTPSTNLGSPVTTTTLNHTGLTASTTYRYQVQALDGGGLTSGYSLIQTATTQGPNTAPTMPTNLQATVASSTQINLSWGPSTDNVAVTGYQVQWCSGAGCTPSTNLGSPVTTTTLNHTGLTASTTYRYQVKALDGGGLSSSYTPIQTATTQATNTAPTMPSNLQATVASATQINLSWGPSNDNVAVTGYQVQWCSGASCTPSTNLGSPVTTTTLSHTGLTASTTYRYKVKALDGGGLSSSYSPIQTATTQAAPPAPTGLKSTAVSNKEIDIAWNAVSGAIGYIVERCVGASCSTYTQLGSTTINLFAYDAGLTAATSYRYRVRSLVGSNQSAPSSVITVSTLAAAACN